MIELSDPKKHVTQFKVSLYAFVPLKRLNRNWKTDFTKYRQQVKADAQIRNTEAELWYWEQKDLKQDFSYHYHAMAKCDEESNKESFVCRTVTLRLFLVKFISTQLNRNGRYYLVVASGIDRHFPDGTSCSQKDLIYLKKAFYERGNDGLCSLASGIPYFHDWLGSMVERFTGKKSTGRFNRHYVVNVQAVSFNRDDGSNDFNSQFFEGKIQRYGDVIEGADKLAYALLYGNDNIEAVPPETVEETFKSTFTNNISQKMFAGNRTIVFIKTHGDPDHCCKQTGEPAAFDADFGSALNVFDICFVMEAKFRLKSIQKMTEGNHPFRTRRVLAAISGYMKVNPFHLAEIKKRTSYLYEALGVNELFHTVEKQSQLLTESSTALMTHKLSKRVGWLTFLTVLLTLCQLIVSILSCNNYNEPNSLSSMCNCMFCGADAQVVFGVVGVLLLLGVVASIFVIAAYLVKSYWLLEKIENELKELNQ